MLGRKEINDRIGSHVLSPKTISDVNTLRQFVAGLMANVDYVVPDSREKDIAMEAFETALMWCTKALARNQDVATVDIDKEGMLEEPNGNLRYPPPSATEAAELIRQMTEAGDAILKDVAVPKDRVDSYDSVTALQNKNVMDTVVTNIDPDELRHRMGLIKRHSD